MSSRSMFDPRNIFLLPATVLGTFRHADWRGAREESGIAGIATEIAQSAIGANTMAFFIPTNSEWQIQDVEALLARYGVKLWGVGYWNGEMYFRVKKRQAHWAQYVMLREGVPLLHGLMDTSRALPPAARTALDAPASDPTDRFLAWMSGVLDWKAGRSGAPHREDSGLTPVATSTASSAATQPRFRVIIADGSTGEST